MTGFQISGNPGDVVGRKPRNDHEKSMVLRFPPGLRDRLDAVLRAGENRTSFIQALIVEEVERREPTSKKP